MWMRMIRLWLVVLVCASPLAALVVSPANAQLEIFITRGVERPIPMAIVPFQWEGAGLEAPFDVSGLVSSDLQQSGRFDPMPVNDMVSRPSLPTCCAIVSC